MYSLLTSCGIHQKIKDWRGREIALALGGKIFWPGYWFPLGRILVCLVGVSWSQTLTEHGRT